MSVCPEHDVSTQSAQLISPVETFRSQSQYSIYSTHTVLKAFSFIDLFSKSLSRSHLSKKAHLVGFACSDFGLRVFYWLLLIVSSIETSELSICGY